MTDAATMFPPLRLKRNEERRLQAGHVWVFSNEVNVAVTPLKEFEPGEIVQIQAHNGKSLGTGYVNPMSLICARLVSRDTAHPVSPSLLVHRLKVALGLRERLFERPFYRLVYGEGDGLPGLVIDRFGDICIVQITTAGMERFKSEIVAALTKVVAPTGVLWRNDSAIRALEGLDCYVEDAAGTVPDQVVLEEGGTTFNVPLRAGQKTGWFFDHRINRSRLPAYTRNLRVLDVFSYLGAWGLQAAVHGAREVVSVDSSSAALGRVSENASLNAVSDRVTTIQGDAFTTLRQLRESRERFDLVILDPPALIKRRKDYKQGCQAYRRLNEMAMQVLAREGFLVSCSCSHLLSVDELGRAILGASRHLDRFVQVLEYGRQAPDHPVHPAIPETEYLKALFARVLPA